MNYWVLIIVYSVNKYCHVSSECNHNWYLHAYFYFIIVVAISCFILVIGNEYHVSIYCVSLYLLTSLLKTLFYSGIASVDYGICFELMAISYLARYHLVYYTNYFWNTLAFSYLTNDSISKYVEHRQFIISAIEPFNPRWI